LINSDETKLPTSS